jgi:hypothetical protein
MTITRSRNLTFEPLICGRSMISRHTMFLLARAFMENCRVRYMVQIVTPHVSNLQDYVNHMFKRP